MAYARLLRIWKNSGQRARCRRCHVLIMWAIDAAGQSRPLAVTATPLRTEAPDAHGRIFEVYEPTAVHACVRRTR